MCGLGHRCASTNQIVWVGNRRTVSALISSADDDLQPKLNRCTNTSWIGNRTCEHELHLTPWFKPSMDSTSLKRTVPSKELILDLDLRWWAAACKPLRPTCSASPPFQRAIAR